MQLDSLLEGVSMLNLFLYILAALVPLLVLGTPAHWRREARTFLCRQPEEVAAAEDPAAAEAPAGTAEAPTAAEAPAAAEAGVTAEAPAEVAAAEAPAAAEAGVTAETPAGTEAPMVMETPAEVAAPIPPATPSRPPRPCSHCGDENPPKQLRCSRCRNVWYCSQACQAADWPAHRTRCKPNAKPSASPGVSSAGARPASARRQTFQERCAEWEAAMRQADGHFMQDIASASRAAAGQWTSAAATMEAVGDGDTADQELALRLASESHKLASHALLRAGDHAAAARAADLSVERAKACQTAAAAAAAAASSQPPPAATDAAMDAATESEAGAAQRIAEQVAKLARPRDREDALEALSKEHVLKGWNIRHKTADAQLVEALSARGCVRLRTHGVLAALLDQQAAVDLAERVGGVGAAPEAVARSGLARAMHALGREEEAYAEIAVGIVSRRG